MKQKNQAGLTFQDRKLNQCSVCGTRKQLGMTNTTTGKIYFLCKSHFLLNELMLRALARVSQKELSR